MQGETRYCSICGHRCHCYGSFCTEEVGVGMSDKTQHCGCKKCKCGNKEWKEHYDSTW